MLTDINSAEDALTSPDEVMVAARVAKTLVASELTTAVASEERPLESVERSVWTAW